MKKTIWLVFNIAISGLFAWLALKEINVDALSASFARISIPFIVLSIAMNLLSCWVRSWRFLEMARPIKTLPKSTSYASIMIGLMVNNVLPFRLGELARGHYLKRAAGMSFTTSIGLVIIERILDVLSLLFLFGILVFFFPFPSWVRRGGAIVLGIMVVVILALFLISRNLARVRRFIDLVVFRFSPRAADRLHRLAASFAEGVRFAHSTGAYGKMAFQTALIWTSYVVAVWAMFPAMGFDKQYGLGMFEATVVMVFSTFAILIPSAPGYVGTFHEVAKQSLMFFRVPREPALALAIVFHAIHYVSITSIGLVLFFKSQMSFGDTLKSVESEATVVS